MKTGIVFPGMGPCGYDELGKFMATSPHARKLRRTADSVLGYPLMDRYRTAGADYSEYSQIAFLISCLALIEQVSDSLESEPAACAGPSFGGKAAVAYSAALPVDELIMLAARLARCEEEYFATEHEDVVTQSIARTAGPVLAEILAAMTERNEWHDISCHIDEDFYMVSMRETSLDRFLKEVRAAGGLPLYAMRPPMHSSAFGALRRKAEDEVLGDVPFSDPSLPIIADHDGSVVTTADGVRSMLLDSFVRAVRWPQVVQAMRELDVTKVYIPGPDSLFGRVRCTTRHFAVVPIKPLMPEGRRPVHVE
jgi:[acyl-carrier-protein] S-malonyltransferase